MTAEEINEHAQRMVQLFPSDKALNECECCQRHSAKFRVIFEWRGEYLTVETAFVSLIASVISIATVHHLFHSLMPSKHINFSTTHGFCNDCFARIKRRRMIAKLAKQLCLSLIALAILIFVSVIVFILVFVFSQPTKIMLAYTAIGLCCGLICLLVGLTAEDRIVRWCLPTTMRFISRPPFELVGIQKI